MGGWRVSYLAQEVCMCDRWSDDGRDLWRDGE